jgi:hypothetical protein
MAITGAGLEVIAIKRGVGTPAALAADTKKIAVTLQASLNPALGVRGFFKHHG